MSRTGEVTFLLLLCPRIFSIWKAPMWMLPKLNLLIDTFMRGAKPSLLEVKVLLGTDISCVFTRKVEAFPFPCIHSTGVTILMLVKYWICFVKSEIIITVKAPLPQTHTVFYSAVLTSLAWLSSGGENEEHCWHSQSHTDRKEGEKGNQKPLIISIFPIPYERWECIKKELLAKHIL